MRRFKFLRYLFFSIFIYASCNKSTPPPEQICNIITSMSAIQQLDALNLTINSGTVPLYFECKAVQTGTNLEGPTITVPPSKSIYLKDLFISTPGTYLIYVRAICSGGTGTWTTPATVLISAYCERPYALKYIDTYNHGFEWSIDYTPSQCQVQYGIKDFALGSGLTVTVPNVPFEDALMNANTYYDFYVRAGCGAGWSSWVGPYSYFSPTIKNLCTIPSNVNFTVQTNGSGTPIGASFTWSYNGERKFEYTGVLQGFNVNTGTIYTHNAASGGNPTFICSRNTNYDFYVRAVCVDGSKTAWFGPTVFNIH